MWLASRPAWMMKMYARWAKVSWRRVATIDSRSLRMAERMRASSAEVFALFLSLVLV